MDASAGGGPLDILGQCPDAASRVVTISGEIDIATVAPLREFLEAALAEDRRRMLILDLAGATFIGCAGVDVLLSVQSTATELGVLLVLRHPPRNVRLVLAVTGVLEQLRVEADGADRIQGTELTAN